VRRELPRETALIGFCGAPWTVATYVAEGQGSSDQGEARGWAYRDRSGFQALIDVLTEASIEYLDGQVRAGADALQIFDSWAGSLSDDEFARWVMAPTAKIVRALKARHPAVPIIGFPRGAAANGRRYVVETGVDGLGCDTAMPLALMAEIGRGEKCAVQGNLDPLLLVAGGPRFEERVGQILEAMKGIPFVFNLGHGIVPETPPENVARLVELIRRGSAA
jgi:uroporphyrinogen decarboxylase